MDEHQFFSHVAVSLINFVRINNNRSFVSVPDPKGSFFWRFLIIGFGKQKKISTQIADYPRLTIMLTLA